MTTIAEFVMQMDNIAPEHYQESYDNAGLITGSHRQEITGVLCCLDSTEDVIDEAIEKNCNLVVAHHPIIFRGLKKIHDTYYVHRVIRKAIKNDIAIYASHTNLDNILNNGVNERIAEQLDLNNLKILSPKQENLKLSIYVSELRADILEKELRGRNLSWIKWDIEDKPKADFIYLLDLPSGKFQLLAQYLEAEKFSYEMGAMNRTSLTVGSGIIGLLEMPMTEKQFLAYVCNRMKTEVIRHTQFLNKSISVVAVCGGAGSFLLPDAINAGADVFITGDFKYHEFFDANQQIVIADIGHYESEQFTIKLLRDIIKKNFSTFAVRCTEIHTNPVNYYYG